MISTALLHPQPPSPGHPLLLAPTANHHHHAMHYSKSNYSQTENDKLVCSQNMRTTQSIRHQMMRLLLRHYTSPFLFVAYSSLDLSFHLLISLVIFLFFYPPILPLLSLFRFSHSFFCFFSIFFLLLSQSPFLFLLVLFHLILSRFCSAFSVSFSPPPLTLTPVFVFSLRLSLFCHFLFPLFPSPSFFLLYLSFSFCLHFLSLSLSLSFFP
ncbi:unnamed protein product [Acanthosepion pharaonis]|uniref:Uncharacterized protein n=1 Tax=Acanthosepion pharaonis TaxID=158019 RepID=A0A812CIL7_ACAPH|nr:unnamed protein product [Sepia pharaonis]